MMIFALDKDAKKLARVHDVTMSDAGLKEAADLEEWLASSGGGLFGRQSVLWIARQDRPSDDQRSDLIGVDPRGDLLVTELKRGILEEDGVIQGLSYAAEYAGKTAVELAELFLAHSQKSGSTGLTARADSISDAQSRLSAHVGVGTELNESQIILLVGEDFSAKALAVCDYLNNASGDAAFSMECWRYRLFRSADEKIYFTLEQVLPPPNVRAEVDEKREASKAKKYARDPVRMAFIGDLVDLLWGGPVTAWRRRGQVYECGLTNKAWAKEHEVWLSVHTERPRLILPEELKLDGVPGDLGLEEGKNWDGRRTLEFAGLDSASAKCDQVFGDKLVKVVGLLKETP